jgi:ArsR family transcriptional regulator
MFESARVTDLADELGCTLANASQHLSVLRSAGLVATRREGTTIYYRLAEPEIVAACDIVHRIVGRRLGLVVPATDREPVLGASR